MSLSEYCIQSAPDCGENQISIGNLCYDVKNLNESNPSSNCNVFQELLWNQFNPDVNIISEDEDTTFPACVEKCNKLKECEAVQFDYGTAPDSPTVEPDSYGFGTKNWENCTAGTLGTTTGTCSLANNVTQHAVGPLCSGVFTKSSPPPSSKCCSTIYWKELEKPQSDCVDIYPSTKKHNYGLNPPSKGNPCHGGTYSPAVFRPSDNAGIEVDLATGVEKPSVTRLDSKYSGSGCRAQLAKPDADASDASGKLALQAMGEWCNNNPKLQVCNEFCNNPDNQLYCKQKPYPTKMLVFLILFCVITFFFIYLAIKQYSFTVRGKSLKKEVYALFICAMIVFFTLSVIYIVKFIREDTIFGGADPDAPIPSQDTILNNACYCTGAQCQLGT